MLSVFQGVFGVYGALGLGVRGSARISGFAPSWV